MKNITRFLLVTMLITAIGVCGYELRNISGQYAEEAQLKDELSQYRPEFPKPQEKKEEHKNASRPAVALPDYPAGSTIDLLDAVFEEETNLSVEPAKIVNQSIIDMQNEINRDIVGWLTIPNTQIHYPFVIADDNDYYLRRNVYKKQAAAGTIFMDYRCAGDFTDFNSVIYGHEMKNGSMFGGLKLFADPGFFDLNASGTLFVKDNTYTLEIFAYMVVRSDDKLIYNPSADRKEFFEYVKNNARRYRDPAPTGNVVTLSTCTYEYDGARIVLLATINP